MGLEEELLQLMNGVKGFLKLLSCFLFFDGDEIIDRLEREIKGIDLGEGIGVEGFDEGSE